jgi:septum site-determining protein MinC
MKLKGEMSMLNVLHLQELDVAAICSELKRKRDEVPQFFMQSPLVVDCMQLGEAAAEFDFTRLKIELLDLGFIPVGVRNIPGTMNAMLAQSGWAVMRENRNAFAEDSADTSVDASVSKQVDSSEINPDQTASQPQTEEQQTQQPQQEQSVSIKSVTIDRPVRSGQQIYAADADMTVLAQTSAGSEIMADGSIHVYGALRGRILAGARGNESARIFCSSLQAELIAIAGRYQLLDESDTELKGKPAMIRLEGDKLIIEPLAI